MFKLNLKHSHIQGISLILVLAMLISVLPFQYLTVNAEEKFVDKNVTEMDVHGSNGEVTSPSAIEGSNFNDNLIFDVHGKTTSPSAIDGVYQIESGEHFAWFRDLVNGTLEDGTPQDTEANAVLVKDISMENVIVDGTWIPIGCDEAKSYKGIFDGDGKEITDFNVSFTSQYHALFGYIENSTIKNLNTYGTVSSTERYAAAIVAKATSSKIINCKNYAHVTGDTNNRAGIVAESIDCEILDCINYGNVKGSGNYVGGIVASAINTKIDACINHGNIDVNGMDLGGIAGTHQYSIGGPVPWFPLNPGEPQDIINCKNYGDIKGSDNGNVAGIAGYVHKIINCINEGKIEASSGYAAGIAGSGYYFDNCINKGTINGKNAAGIVNITSGDILNCTNIGDIISDKSAGGISGGVANGTLISIEGCVNKGTVQGVRAVGGIIGSILNNAVAQRYDSSKTFSMLKDCANYGDVNGIGAGGGYDGDIGGLIGYVSFGLPSTNHSHTKTYILNSFNMGNVSGKSELYASGGTGGLVGRAEHMVFGGLTLENSYNAGSVSGKKLVGGIIGGIDLVYMSMVKDMLGEAADTLGITMYNSYSVAESISLNGEADEVDKNTIGGAFGSIFFNVAAGSEVDYSKINLSNLFYNNVDGIKGIGTSKALQRLGTPTPVLKSYMETQDFIDNLGGDYTLYEGTVVKEEYDDLFSSYKYPILRSWVGLKSVERYNVQFVGADYTNVVIDGRPLYSTTVSSGDEINFSVSSKYDEVALISVSHKGEELSVSPITGEYILKNITGDTIITVITEGEPPTEEEDGVFDVQITANPAGSTILVEDEENNIIEPVDGIYKLESKLYTVTISAEGYITKRGTFTPSKDITELNVNLVVNGTPTYAISIDSSIKTYIVSDGLTIDTVTQKEATSLELYPGDYTYTSDSYGGGPFNIPEDSRLSLKTVDYAHSLRNSNNVAYTMSVVDEEKREYFPGGTKVSDGDKRAYFLLPAKQGKVAYNYKFIVNDAYWASAGETYVYNDTQFRSLNLSDSSSFVIAPKRQLTMTVPTGADLKVYQRPKFYLPAGEVKHKALDKSGEQWKYTFDAPADTPIYYELKKEGYVKKASFLNLGRSDLSIIISESQLLKASDYSMDLKDSSQDFFEANILMNVDDSMYLQLHKDGEHELYLFRAWQAINSITGNDYVDPDYHFEVIYGDSVEITDSYYAGATIKAVGKGISVVKVTYDALNFVGGLGTEIFSKLWTENYGVIVVNVDSDSSVKFDTGINVTDYDTLYYIKSINGIESNKQYREYSFTPKAEKAGENVGITSVRVHEPIGDTDWKINNWNDEKYWSSYNASPNGSYTIQLKDGRNIVEISAGGSSTYYSINACGLDITIDGATVTKDESGSLNVTADNGTDSVISFQGLRMPVAKLGAISNPGFPDRTYLVYTESGGIENGIISNRTQYNIRTNNNIKLTLPVEPGDYSLTGGKIHTSAITSGFSSRDMTKGGTDKSNYKPGQNSEENIKGFFSSLPDIHIKVEGEMTAEQFAKEKLRLKNSLDSIYKAYPESMYNAADLSTVKALYEAGISGIDDATDLTAARDAAKIAQDGIKAIQDRILKENAKIIDFRALLSRLPDDVKLLGQYNGYLAQELANKYTAMDQGQKNQLTGMETEKYNRIKDAFIKGLPNLQPFEVSFEIAADTDKSAVAIKSMVESIKALPSNGLLYGTQVYGRDIEGNVLENTGQYSTKAYPDNFVRFAPSIDMFTYLTAGEISGEGWRILNDADVERIGTTNTYNLAKGRTVLIDEVPYEIKNVEISGIEDILSTQAVIKGSNNEDIVLEDAYASFVMPYENAKIKVTWGPVIGGGEIDVALAKAKTEAIASINKEYSSYKSYEYTDDNWIMLTNIKDEGIAHISAEKEMDNIEDFLGDIIAQMRAVSKIVPGGTIDGYGKVLGTIDIYIENTTYSKGAFTGNIVRELEFEYAERDTMMTVILRALKENGYSWTGTGGTKQGGVDDYDIQYLASITKDGKSLGEFDGTPASGWMGTLNDFFTNYGFQEFTARNGKLSDGDEIGVMFTLNMGEDLGGTWGNSDTSLASLKLSDGKIYPSFDSNVHEYTFVMDKLPARVKVNPTASNRNYMVKIFLNDKVTSDREGTSFYKRTRYIPIKSGDYINIGVGEYAWPSMNKQETEARDYSGTWYKLNIISKDSGASHVVSLISSLTKNISINSENEVKNIREIYNLLSPSEQAKVTNLSKLEDAEKKIAFFKEIETVKDLLKKIPAASKITLKDKDAVIAADAAYKKLTDEQKLYVTIGDVKNYNDAIDKLTELGAFNSGGAPSKIVGSDSVPIIEGGTIDVKAETRVLNKEANSKVTDKQIKDAIAEAEKSENVSSITIKAETKEIVTKSTVIVPKLSVTEISGARLDLKVETPVGIISMHEKALIEIARQAQGSSVEIVIENMTPDKLTDEQKAVTEGSTVYDISIISGGKRISSFGGQKITISLPYELKKGQVKEKVTVWYMNDKGELEKISCKYDEKTGLATFTTDRLSYYVVGYDNSLSFIDITEKDWFYSYVMYVIDKGLFKGTGENTFSPDKPMTRAMLVTVLHRLEVIPSATKTATFNDIKSGQWYTDAVAWSVEKEIVKGITETEFKPENNITREQLAVMLYRYAASKDKVSGLTGSIDSFADKDKVSRWAIDAVKWAVGQGIIKGKTNGNIDPSGSATRAEVAAMLQRFIENVK